MKIISLFLIVSTIFTLFLTSTSISTITPNQNIIEGQTITSDDQIFKMGFFSPSNDSSNRYFGIWYNKVPVTTVVWAANRKNPILDTLGELILNHKGILKLVSRTNSLIWSSNSSITGNNPVAQLLDTGNLVIRNDDDINPKNYIWQSFDYPGDAFLPSMKLEKDFVKDEDKNLTSWKSDNCDHYGLCGPYGICTTNKSPTCGCLSGFAPRVPEEWKRADWSNGCVRKMDLNCGDGEGFVKQMGVKLPDTRKTWSNVSMNPEECEKVCLRNCSCTAYANLGIRSGGSGCLIWFNNLVDIRVYAENGQDIYVKMAASELHRKDKAKRRVRIIVILIPVGVMVLLGICAYVYIRRKQMKKGEKEREDQEKLLFNLETIANETNKIEMENWELTVFDFNTIVNATNNFSKYFKVTEGDSYGHIYMGTLEEGTEIALKIFSKISKQAQEEFQSEGRCLAKLQHQNIVKLLGYCPQGKGRMLIFECMPNKSLNSYIFDGERKSSLDWPKRYNIIIGIARGLVYLHQDSHVRIIHRDLKTSSILLDRDMNPKISDFGLARIMEGSLTKAHTTRKLGTFGYMAPEYTIGGIYSTKSDVFSFGVVVLEIVSGMKNRGYHSNHDPNLLGQAWSLYKSNKQLELIDDTIKDSYEESQVNGAIVIGLLCVQKFPEDRPDMPEVLLMLGGDIPLREPKQPGYGMYETN